MRKFEIDDKVEVVCHLSYYYREVGTITRINTNDTYPYRVVFDYGRWSIFTADDLKLY